MTHAITVRLEDSDHAVLAEQAERIGVRPGALARILIRSGLSPEPPVPAEDPGARQRAAVDRLVRRSKRHPPADAVALVAQTRTDDDL